MKLRVAVIVIISTLLLTIVVTATNTLEFDNFELTEVELIEKSQFSDKSVRTSLTLNAAGDILIHDRVYDGARTDDGFDFKSMLEPIKPYLENADLTIANQETILGGEALGLSGFPMFNSPFEVGDALKHAGVNIVSIANNHTIDRGAEAVYNATDYLNQIGIEYVGGYQSQEDASKKRILHRNGISVGFLAYTYGTNGIPVPEGQDYLVNLIDVQQMTDDLQRIREEVDFVVVSMHFGDEYEALPNEEQVYLSQLLTSEGADVILGHHPHVLQPIDWISANGQDKFVVYSLGNFLSGQRGLDRQLGAISQVELVKEIRPSETSLNVTNAKIMPTYNDHEDHGDLMTNVQVVPLVEADQFGLEDAHDIFDEIAEHMQTYSSDVTIVPYLD
ncbi:CapA family protein [Alkalibacillus haloalkaliphilus]|uniref:CapA family protein n=1 Tax=Alkalibacillus haloalkaliphilus TaxID=94136 RepID=UPI00036572FD|nr:CapA family protein [Alkalibacillus haloalkaliphilus]